MSLSYFYKGGRLQPVTLTATPPENEDIDPEPNGTRLLRGLRNAAIISDCGGESLWLHSITPRGSRRVKFSRLSSSLVCVSLTNSN